MIVLALLVASCGTGGALPKTALEAELFDAAVADAKPKDALMDVGFAATMFKREHGDAAVAVASGVLNRPSLLKQRPDVATAAPRIVSGESKAFGTLERLSRSRDVSARVRLLAFETRAAAGLPAEALAEQMLWEPDLRARTRALDLLIAARPEPEVLAGYAEKALASERDPQLRTRLSSLVALRTDPAECSLIGSMPLDDASSVCAYECYGTYRPPRVISAGPCPRKVKGSREPRTLKPTP